MNDAKSDRRVRKTKNAIRGAFLELLDEKNFDEITILELTERADVNRKTFYNHYSSVQDVISEIEDEWIGQLDLVLEELILPFKNAQPLTMEHFREHAAEVCRPIFATTIMALRENPAYFKLISGTDGHSDLVYKTVMREKETLLSLYHNTISERESMWMEYMLIFIMNGTLATINEWWKKGYPVSTDDMIDFLTILFKSDATFEYIRFSSTDNNK